MRKIRRAGCRAVVNENFVRRCLPNVEPLTQRIVTERLVPGAQTQQTQVQWQRAKLRCTQ
jgi:hypothetical protein